MGHCLEEEDELTRCQITIVGIWSAEVQVGFNFEDEKDSSRWASIIAESLCDASATVMGHFGHLQDVL